jgi:hypothetical protein
MELLLFPVTSQDKACVWEPSGALPSSYCADAWHLGILQGVCGCLGRMRWAGGRSLTPFSHLSCS